MEGMCINLAYLLKHKITINHLCGQFSSLACFQVFTGSMQYKQILQCLNIEREVVGRAFTSPYSLVLIIPMSIELVNSGNLTLFACRRT